MLHLTRRIAFGVDVGDLLQLQGSFERDWIVDAATEVEKVLRMTIFPGDLRDLLGALHGLGNELRQVHQIVNERPALLFIESTEVSSDVQGQQIKGSELRGKRFGAGDRDFGSGVRVEHGIGFSRDRRIDGVADRKNRGALLFRFFDSGKCVRGLAGLRDGQQECVRPENAPIVAVSLPLVPIRFLVGKEDPFLDLFFGIK